MTKFSLHKEGLLTIGFTLACTAVAFFFVPALGLCGICVAALVTYFFRDPQRAIAISKDFVLSPADGLICKIENALPPQSSELVEEMQKISVYLSPLNVHVNRIPVDGIVRKLHYVPGKNLRADYDSSEDENERQESTIEMADGRNVVVVQQTGFLARRVVCDLRKDQQVSAGKRFGIIKFGSRVTVYIPKDMPLLVSEGQTVVAGETILALLSETASLVTERFLD
ncbi:phosphatidylserine decarboxylase [Neorickettsia sennetsu]|uniref:Phosphatidylserine decarboxylase proenzyme n=1 Tax=Ehrlichia sennetsu (strain ATCC VR-367 / Miyayama) TaxID=222891 RepID=PSD_EHRS3|nr:phosphatidylserine decarboxylase [Neorickettsia sennetsu]Q2GEF4.1 RecName: Full=Phosphatidylserine decarboxylase proenzyme; Contains: RecName: Full=Phosphatidylserine decarboxylase alpha chain; Contains: RecName: Full=Phosphatidylserine decarboxylase beta chain [Neorickettsia sennetsu str. Miyayama]ABD46210.1 phosphatidylserine decarboxylase-related protein [Neorickettsia sennetsu str. Miyayama]